MPATRGDNHTADVRRSALVILLVMSAVPRSVSACSFNEYFYLVSSDVDAGSWIWLRGRSPGLPGRTVTGGMLEGPDGAQISLVIAETIDTRLGDRYLALRPEGLLEPGVTYRVSGDYINLGQEVHVRPAPATTVTPAVDVSYVTYDEGVCRTGALVYLCVGDPSGAALDVSIIDELGTEIARGITHGDSFVLALTDRPDAFWARVRAIGPDGVRGTEITVPLSSVPGQSPEGSGLGPNATCRGGIASVDGVPVIRAGCSVSSGRAPPTMALVFGLLGLVLFRRRR